MKGLKPIHDNYLLYLKMSTLASN